MPQNDLIIIGAGPAGMAAAQTAAAQGLRVLLLDEQAAAGGQIYRDVDRVAPLRGPVLGTDYTYGTSLTGALHHDLITHLTGAVVWAVEEGFHVSYTHKGSAARAFGKRVILATGALERPMPIPGWTLPGVMTAGAAQILLKQSGVLARRAVLVGAGPLLYLVAAQMIRAGTPPLALIETSGGSTLRQAARHFGKALRGWRYLAKGLSLLAEIRRAGIPRFTGATDLAIEGEGHVRAIRFTHKGRAQRIDCDTALLHHGIVPNTQAARSLGVEHRWHAAQACFVPVLDRWGHTSVAGLYAAGDGAVTGGAIHAEISGRLAALAVAADLAALDVAARDRQAAPLFRQQAGALSIRPFLDTAYPPFAQALHPADTTIVCRCEEVTAGDIRTYARIGCLGPNQAKAFGRAGMGPCQGRYCGLTVTTLLATANGATPDETGYYRIRAPLKPVTLGELASLPPDGDQAGAARQ